jgi:hypothetical protein
MSEELTEVATEVKKVETTPPVKSYFSNFSKQSIRQFIGVSLTGLVCWETVVSNQIDATVLIGIYGTVLGFYFGEGD